MTSRRKSFGNRMPRPADCPFGANGSCGQKIKRITTTAASYAFWISENRLIVIIFIPRSFSSQDFYNRFFLLNWLRHDPSALTSTTP